ncbi:gliding motility-associated C-terminal domain-containing protein [Plebeiibacterium sediminum]|uniref:Gliding motility-associated C-terminal domain-containing protein n=1 Tax=Plebeiibacterium sediminum TaxID=2992112 RepID=A0AAE3SG34_9BACT|nr:gliding motility-associated C-terminal domain-containing protein [Plebeiobacterium sediminum]MCW3788068.1 gliding motility-associated C-terminal domain-containing protein [Plebeiobacterium sediminum]
MKHILHILLFFAFNLIFTTVNAQDPPYPTVTIVSDDVEFCESGTADVTIQFTGEPPFAIYYEIGGAYQTVGFDEGTGLQTISNYEHTFSITQTSTDDVNILKVYDNNYQIAPLNHSTKLNSGSDLVSGSMNIQIDQMPTPDAGVTDKICGYEYTLQGSVSDATHTIYWNDMTGVGSYSDINSSTSTFAKNEEGQVTFILTEENGACTATDEVTIDFHGSPTATLNSPGEYKFCSTDSEADIVAYSVNFTGNAPFDYVIKNNTNSYNETSTTLTANLEYPVSTSDQFYILSVTDVNGCSAIEEDITGTQIVTDLKPNTQAGEDQIVCGKEFTLEAIPSSGTSGEWSSAATGINYGVNSNANTSVTSDNYQLVALTWTETSDELSCINSDEVQIRFAEPPVLELLNTEDQICNGSSTYVNLNITNGNAPFSVSYNDETETYSKTELSLGSISLELNPTYDITSPVQSQTDFHFTSIEGVYGCEASYSDLVYSVSVDQQPMANAGDPSLDSPCDDTIELQASNSVGEGYWSPSSEGTFDDESNPEAMFTVSPINEPTQYILTWNVINGECYDSDNVEFTVKPFPTPVIAGKDSTIFALDNIQLYAETLEVGSGTWSLLEGSATIVDPSNTISVVTGMEPGVYRFKWTVDVEEGGCAIEDEVTITMKELFETGGFSPNGDAINDEFKIPGSENLHNIKFVVFNKFGKLVHEEVYSENVRISWDGKGLDGEVVKEGVYYYIFDADELSKPVKKYLVIKR